MRIRRNLASFEYEAQARAGVRSLGFGRGTESIRPVRGITADPRGYVPWRRRSYFEVRGELSHLAPILEQCTNQRKAMNHTMGLKEGRKIRTHGQTWASSSHSPIFLGRRSIMSGPRKVDAVRKVGFSPTPSELHKETCPARL